MTDHMSHSLDEHEAPVHPLERVESVLAEHNWNFDRVSVDSLCLNIQGSACVYHIVFIWQEPLDMLQISCEYGLKIHDVHAQDALRTVMEMNLSLWMGHFEFSHRDLRPRYRHGIIMQGGAGMHNAIEDFIEISLAQCEQHISVFQMLADERPILPELLSLALMETAGES